MGVTRYVVVSLVCIMKAVCARHLCISTGTQHRPGQLTLLAISSCYQHPMKKWSEKSEILIILIFVSDRNFPTY